MESSKQKARLTYVGELADISLSTVDHVLNERGSVYRLQGRRPVFQGAAGDLLQVLARRPNRGLHTEPIKNDLDV